MISRLKAALILLFTATISIAGNIETHPTFESCSFYWSPVTKTQEAAILDFRAKGEKDWHEALTPRYFKEESMFRGSIVNLKENTSYEIRISDKNGKVLASSEFTTWKTNLPIGPEINILDRVTKNGILITDKGSPEAWIRFKAPEGTILNGDTFSSSSSATVELKGAEYVILDGLHIKGGHRHGIAVSDSKNIRILNCDISGWGRPGTIQKSPVLYFDPKGNLIIDDCGVYAQNDSGLVVERCYIHDPRSNSNSWRYGHPAGSYAMRVGKMESTVVRYNDFVGSDEHRWLDVIGSRENGAVNGGFNRDADIYGNFLAFPQDDGVELDGGQMNVRFFGNKVEGGLCGVSLRPNLKGPSYVFGNLFVNGGDVDGRAGNVFKDFKNGGTAYYFNNTVFSNGGSGLYKLEGYRMVCNNVVSVSKNLAMSALPPIADYNSNILWSRRQSSNTEFLPGKGKILAEPAFIDVSHGLYGLVNGRDESASGTRLPNFNESALSGKAAIGAFAPGSVLTFPSARPVKFIPDRGQIIFNPHLYKDEIVVVKAISPEFSGRLRIRKNDSFKWFEVSPSEGFLDKNGDLTFKVSLVSANMPYNGSYAGAFLISQDNGLSVPVSIYAWKLGKAEKEISYPADGAVLLEAAHISGTKNLNDKNAVNGKAACIDTKESIWNFKIQHEDDYFILLHGKSPSMPHLSICIDGETFQSQCDFFHESRYLWSGFRNSKQKFKYPKAAWVTPRFGLFHFKPGGHELKIKTNEEFPVLVDQILITPSFKLEHGRLGNFGDIPVSMPASN